MSDMGTEVSELSVTEFVTARLDEDEARATRASSSAWPVVANMAAGCSAVAGWHVLDHSPARVLAQCAAMRQVVEMAAWAQSDIEQLAPRFAGVQVCVERKMLGALASIWSDHPDWREEWR